MRFAIVLALLAAPAGATVYEVRVPGIITTQLTEGIDPLGIAVGNAMTFTGRFDSRNARLVGGEWLAANRSFVIETDGSRWTPDDDIIGFAAPAYVEASEDDLFWIGWPNITFNAGHVTGINGILASFDTRPTLGTGSAGFIINNELSYGNPNTPGFVGTWDYAASSINAVPEPATWAMLVLGFGTVGAMARRHGKPVHHTA